MRISPASDLKANLAWADVLIALNARLDATALSQGKFGLVQQYGVGLDNVDIAAATRQGIYVARVPGDISGNAASVAEHAIFLMLALSRKFPQTQLELAARRVGAPTGAALCGKTACIVGLGSIGQLLAPRLHALGLRLVGAHNHPLRKSPAELHLDEFHDLAELAQATAQADYVILCLNYKPELRYFFSTDFLAGLKASAYLVNVARGGLLDPEALTKALARGGLAGAGLDVFWEEPVDTAHPLFAQNVVATPHVAGVTDISYQGIAEVCAENIMRYAAGETPLYAVNLPEEPLRRTLSA